MYWLENSTHWQPTDNEKYRLSPLRVGEQSRVCQICGCEYKPKSRTQRYCPDCKKEAKRRNRKAYEERMKSK